MIPDEIIERIRESADIVGIIGEHVNLKKTGSDYRGPCPFHQGTHRNFSVIPAKQYYHCFVCGESGDVFKFLQKRLGMEWPQAVRMVAERVGIDVPESRRQQEGPDPRERFWSVNAQAAEYFAQMLNEDDLGAAAREYVQTRDITVDEGRKWGLGFAPREMGFFRSHMATLGHDDAFLLEAGLLVKREEGDEPRPRFRNRLIFPILDASARVVGFGGRLMGPGEPKYLNSAETPVFTKGKVLYGMDKARYVARRDDRLLVVEGYFDVMRLAIAGVESVVAPLGTALTEDQAALVTRYTKNVFLLYDSDAAGLKATFRSGDVLLKLGASVRVVTLPKEEDPDTFVQTRGAAALERLLDDSVDVFERKMQILERGGWFDDLHKRRLALDRLLPTIRATADPLLRDMYIGRASEASRLDREVLRAEVTGKSDPSPTRRGNGGAPLDEGPPPQEESSHSPTRVRTERPPRRAPPRLTGPGISAERELVRAMLKERSLVVRIVERVDPDSFRESRYREIFGNLLRLGADVLIDELIAALSPEANEELEQLLAGLEGIQDMERTVESSLTRLHIRQLRDENAEIDRLMSTALGNEKDELNVRKRSNTHEISRLTTTLT